MRTIYALKDAWGGQLVLIIYQPINDRDFPDREYHKRYM